MFVQGLSLFALTVGGMKRSGLRSCGRITRYNFDVGYYALYTTETAMFYDRML